MVIGLAHLEAEEFERGVRNGNAATTESRHSITRLVKRKINRPHGVCDRIGMDRPSFNMLLQGNGHIDASLSTYLVGALEQDEIPEYWLFMQRDYDNWKKTHP
jgi:hypothetical protein